MKFNWRNLISDPTNATPVVAKEGGDPIPEALARISILSERFNKLYQTGKFAKAIPIAQEGLDISEKALGPDHLQTSMLLNNLAEMFRLTEDYGKAEPLFQRALAIREKELGPDHPQTATVLNNLALLYTSQKEYTKAEPLQQRSLEIDEKTLGPDHPQTASALGNLAALYYVMGEKTKAEPLYERSLKICEKALGPDHPQTTTVRKNLATVKESLVDSKESVSPPLNDEAKIVSLNQRVALLYQLGRYAEAIPVAQECLDLSEKVFGPDDPKTAREVNNLGELYNAMADFGNAAQLYQRSLDIYVKTLGPIDPQTVTVFHNLDALKRKAVAKIESLHDQAGVLYKRKQYAEAIPIAQECLELSEKVVGPDDADTARKLLMVGVLYRKSGDHFTAEPLYQRALKILEKELGPEHPDTAQALNHLGLLYEGMSDYAKAEPLYQRSLEICEKTLGVDDVQTIAIQRNLTTTRESLNSEKGPAAAGAPLDSLRFSNNELNTLIFAPMWIYSAVSEVDGAPKDYEKEAWNREVSTPESYTSPLFQFVLELGRGKWDTFLPHWSADTRSTPNGLRDVRRIVDSKLHVDDAKEFKESLYQFGRAIAESGGEGAPGGGVLQMPKVSFDEQDVLIDIGIMLGLQDGVRPLSPWLESMFAALDDRAVAPADTALHQTPTSGQSSTQSPGSETQSAELSSSEPKKVPLREMAPSPIPAVLEPAAPLAPPSLPTVLQTSTEGDATSPGSPERRAAEVRPSLPKKDPLTEDVPPPTPVVSAASGPPPGIALSPKHAPATKEEKAPSSIAQQRANPKSLIVFGSLAAVVLLGVVGYFVFRPKPHARTFSSHVTPTSWKTYVSTKEKFRSDLQAHMVAFSFDYFPNFIASPSKADIFIDLNKYAADGTNMAESFTVFWEDATTDTPKERSRVLGDLGHQLAKMYSQFNCKERATATFTVGGVNGTGRLWEFTTRDRNAHFVAGFRTILAHPPGNPRGLRIDLFGTEYDPRVKSATDVGVNDDLAAILRSFKFL